MLRELPFFRAAFDATFNPLAREAAAEHEQRSSLGSRRCSTDEQVLIEPVWLPAVASPLSSLLGFHVRLSRLTRPPTPFPPPSLSDPFPPAQEEDRIVTVEVAELKKRLADRSNAPTGKKLKEVLLRVV
jgi:hypothetical protein